MWYGDTDDIPALLQGVVILIGIADEADGGFQFLLGAFVASALFIALGNESFGLSVEDVIEQAIVFTV